MAALMLFLLIFIMVSRRNSDERGETFTPVKSREYMRLILAQNLKYFSSGAWRKRDCCTTVRCGVKKDNYKSVNDMRTITRCCRQ